MWPTSITGGGGGCKRLTNGAQFVVGSFGGAQYVGTITYTPTSVVLSNLHPIPEPAHVLLLAGAAAAAWAWRRRRKAEAFCVQGPRQVG